MIYLDPSAALAQLPADDRDRPAEFRGQELISRGILEYEVWTALHRRRLGKSHGEAARTIVQSLTIVELSRDVLRRAVEPFPVAVRTLDALHLATLAFLEAQGLEVELASYDARLNEAAKALGFVLADC